MKLNRYIFVIGVLIQIVSIEGSTYCENLKGGVDLYKKSIQNIESTGQDSILAKVPVVSGASHTFYYRKSDGIVVAACSNASKNEASADFYWTKIGMSGYQPCVVIDKRDLIEQNGVVTASKRFLGIGYTVLADRIDFFVIPDGNTSSSTYTNIITYLNVGSIIGKKLPIQLPDTDDKKAANKAPLEKIAEQFAKLPIQANVTRKIQEGSATIESSGYVVTLKNYSGSYLIVSDTSTTLDRMYLLNTVGSGSEKYYSYSNTAKLFQYEKGDVNLNPGVRCIFVDRKLPYEHSSFFTFFKVDDIGDTLRVMQFALIKGEIYVAGAMNFTNPTTASSWPLRTVWNKDGDTTYVYCQLYNRFMRDLWYTPVQVQHYKDHLKLINYSFAPQNECFYLPESSLGIDAYTVRRYKYTPKPTDNTNPYYNPYELDAVGYRIFELGSIAAIKNNIPNATKYFTTDIPYAFYPLWNEKGTPDDVLLTTKLYNSNVAGAKNLIWVTQAWLSRDTFKPVFPDVSVGYNVEIIDTSSLKITLPQDARIPAIILRYSNAGITTLTPELLEAEKAERARLDEKLREEIAQKELQKKEMQRLAIAKQEELAARDAQLKEEAAQKAAEEKRIADQKAAEEAEAKRKADEEATRKAAEEKRIADQKAAEEDEVKRKADEEATRKAAEEKRIADQKAAEEAEVKRKADEEAAKKVQQQQQLQLPKKKLVSVLKKTITKSVTNAVQNTTKTVKKVLKRIETKSKKS